MTLNTAREWVRSRAANAGDASVYSDADVDRAVLEITTRFARVTRCMRGYATMSLVASDASVPATPGEGEEAEEWPVDFRPERVMRAYLVGEDLPALSLVDHQTIMDSRAQNASESAPTAIGFTSTTTAEVWPTPDDSYTLGIIYWQPATQFAPGADGDTTLNLPDDYLVEILSSGAPAVLQRHEPENAARVAAAWQTYLEWERMQRGANGYGARSLIMSPDE